jgi:acetyl esterase
MAPAPVITAGKIPFATNVKLMRGNSSKAGVAVTATRYNGMIHDFLLLNAIHGEAVVQAALRQASEAIRGALKP